MDGLKLQLLVGGNSFSQLRTLRYWNYSVVRVFSLKPFVGVSGFKRKREDCFVEKNNALWGKRSPICVFLQKLVPQADVYIMCILYAM